MSKKFDTAMANTSANSVSGAPAATLDTTSSGGNIDTQMDAIKTTLQTIQQLIQSLINTLNQKSPAGASSQANSSSIIPVQGQSNLGGTQGPSERIPEPTQNVREIDLGGKTMTIGGDGSVSNAEVNAAAAEMQRMYDTSPTFRASVDNAQSADLTVTVGKRGDNTSWGGGGRIFLNVNNITPGNNDTFQGIVGHEMGHAAQGLSHGAALDNMEEDVRMEA